MDDERAIDFVLNGEPHRLSRAQVLSAAGRGGPEPAVPTGADRPPVKNDLGSAVKSFIDLHEFFGQEDLSSRVVRLEAQLEGADAETVDARVAPEGMTDDLIRGALLVRRHAGRVNDLIHAAMIVRALPKILEPGERIVRRPSLASGNDQSRKFDVETDRRVAEFKAAQWKGRDTMRKRMLVTDLVGLVLERGERRAELYVLGRLPIEFLRKSTSTIDWALGRSSPHLRRAYEQRFGSAELTISQFTAGPAADVALVDLAELLGIG
ncbi:hypothetical protein [Amycolatopsis sp. cmx-4-68]|uniref:hypothetical protein n=1 Tax=Amycolatopsis sp. cmx-4-68 TaxID=2790938 RepID=UPI00397E1AA2